MSAATCSCELSAWSGTRPPRGGNMAAFFQVTHEAWEGQVRGERKKAAVHTSSATARSSWWKTPRDSRTICRGQHVPHVAEPLVSVRGHDQPARPAPGLRDYSFSRWTLNQYFAPGTACAIPIVSHRARRGRDGGPRPDAALRAEKSGLRSDRLHRRSQPGTAGAPQAGVPKGTDGGQFAPLRPRQASPHWGATEAPSDAEKREIGHRAWQYLDYPRAFRYQDSSGLNRCGV